VIERRLRDQLYPSIEPYETGKLARRMYWLDMGDTSVVLAMTQGIGTALTADEKRAHLADIGREHLIDQVCTQEILPPE